MTCGSDPIEIGNQGSNVKATLTQFISPAAYEIFNYKQSPPIPYSNLNTHIENKLEFTTETKKGNYSYWSSDYKCHCGY